MGRACALAMVLPAWTSLMSNLCWPKMNGNEQSSQFGKTKMCSVCHSTKHLNGSTFLLTNNSLTMGHTTWFIIPVDAVDCWNPALVGMVNTFIQFTELFVSCQHAPHQHRHRQPLHCRVDLLHQLHGMDLKTARMKLQNIFDFKWLVGGFINLDYVILIVGSMSQAYCPPIYTIIDYNESTHQIVYMEMPVDQESFKWCLG